MAYNDKVTAGDQYVMNIVEDIHKGRRLAIDGYFDVAERALMFACDSLAYRIEYDKAWRGHQEIDKDLVKYKKTLVGKPTKIIAKEMTIQHIRILLRETSKLLARGGVLDSQVVTDTVNISELQDGSESNSPEKS